MSINATIPNPVEPTWCGICGRKVRKTVKVLRRFWAGSPLREFNPGSEICVRCSNTVVPGHT